MNSAELQDLQNRHIKKSRYDPSERVNGDTMIFLFQVVPFTATEGFTSEDLAVLADFSFDGLDYEPVEQAFFEACQELRSQFATGRFDAVKAATMYLKVDQAEAEAKSKLVTTWLDRLSGRGNEIFQINQRKTLLGKEYISVTTDWVSMADEEPEYVLSRLMRGCERKQELGSIKPNLKRRSGIGNFREIGDGSPNKGIANVTPEDLADPEKLKAILKDAENGSQGDDK
jgi:hypothetical protein